MHPATLHGVGVIAKLYFIIFAVTSRGKKARIAINGIPMTELRNVVGLVIERSRARLPAGALPGSLGQLSLTSLRGR